MHADPQFWNDIAERYAQQPVANMPAYEAKLVATKERLTPRDVVLDIGCGTGSLALELASHVHHVHAIDVSEEMVRIARRKTQAAEVDNITYYVGAFSGLETLEPASFDVICAYNILHLLPQREAALRAIQTLLKPGGLLVSSTPCLGESYVPYALILPIMRWLGKAPPVHILRAAEVQAELDAAGFVELRTRDVGAAKTTLFLMARRPYGEARAQLA